MSFGVSVTVRTMTRVWSGSSSSSPRRGRSGSRRVLAFVRATLSRTKTGTRVLYPPLRRLSSPPSHRCAVGAAADGVSAGRACRALGGGVTRYSAISATAIRTASAATTAQRRMRPSGGRRRRRRPCSSNGMFCPTAIGWRRNRARSSRGPRPGRRHTDCTSAEGRSVQICGCSRPPPSSTTPHVARVRSRVSLREPGRRLSGATRPLGRMTQALTMTCLSDERGDVRFRCWVACS
jgi:hypothetical protein